MPTKVSLLLILAAMLLPSMPRDQSTADRAYDDLLIKNGLIIDGSGRPGYRANIAIDGDRIVAMNVGNGDADPSICRVTKDLGDRAARAQDPQIVIDEPVHRGHLANHEIEGGCRALELRALQS